MAQSLWKTLQKFLKMFNIQFYLTQQFDSQRNKTISPHKTLYTNVQCSFIPNRHKVVCLSIVEWINKIWYIVTEKNKLWILATTWMNLENTILRESDWSQTCHILCYYIYMKYSKQTILQRQKVFSSCVRLLRLENSQVKAKESRNFLQWYILKLTVVKAVHEYSKKHSTVHSKQVNCKVLKLCLKKSLKEMRFEVSTN